MKEKDRVPDKLFDALEAWQDDFKPFVASETLSVDEDAASEALAELADRLRDNYPFFHPCYAGQMLKPPHPIAMQAYRYAMNINPNNHALDGGPATAALEKEAIALLAKMFGFPQHLGHLTSSGTIANLEALWIARCLHPGKRIAYSSQSHYTHSRMCQVLGVEGIEIEVDDRGKMSLPDLKRKAKAYEIGTIVATLGTTGLGAIDPLDEIIDFARGSDIRVHADAAYGGYYKILADLEPSPVPREAFRAIAQADSIVVDPHKHGLQPYGCGCVLFRDPSIGVLYRHDSPYTYFTSKDLHLGEISLECSRAGAAAAALWTTLRCLPLQPNGGMGLILQATRRAALSWAALIEDSPILHLVTPPELDIITYFSAASGWEASTISRETERIFKNLMEDEDPVYLAMMTLPKELLASNRPEIVWDQEKIIVLRSCLMKPEHEAAIPWLHARVEGEAKGSGSPAI